VFDPLLVMPIRTYQNTDQKHTKKLTVMIEDCMRAGESPSQVVRLT
jgi:hypothetical protein